MNTTPLALVYTAALAEKTHDERYLCEKLLAKRRIAVASTREGATAFAACRLGE